MPATYACPDKDNLGNNVALLYKMPCGKGETIQPYIHRNLPKINHLHLGHNLSVKYHDPSASSSTNILFTRSFMGCISLERGIIQLNFA